ncbi:unnamed protein product, partial [Prorocentrum cordatum]
PLEDLFAPDFRCVPRLIGHWHRPGQLIDQRTGAGTPASGWLSSVAMELVEGQGFEEHLAGLATEGSVRDVLEAALELLECLGAREVEHGDLWAPNLLVARPPSGGRARLVAIDFGAARLRPRGGLQAEDLLVLDGRARGSPPGVAAAQGVLSQAEQRALLFLRRAGVAAEDFPELIPNFFVGTGELSERAVEGRGDRGMLGEVLWHHLLSPAAPPALRRLAAPHQHLVDALRNSRCSSIDCQDGWPLAELRRWWIAELEQPRSEKGARSALSSPVSAA